MQKIKGTFLIQNVRNVNTINQGIENSIPKSFDSETNSESGFKGQRFLVLSNLESYTVSTAKLRNKAPLSQQRDLSEFSQQIKPGLARAFSVNTNGNRRPFLKRTNLSRKLHPVFLLCTSVEPLSSFLKSTGCSQLSLSNVVFLSHFFIFFFTLKVFFPNSLHKMLMPHIFCLSVQVLQS